MTQLKDFITGKEIENRNHYRRARSKNAVGVLLPTLTNSIRKMNSNEHAFGGEQTRIKLATLQKYLPAYTTALSKRHFRLNYIDAFAGTGVCRVEIGGEKRLIRGSASIALECKPPFHRIFFIEAKRRHADALIRLRDLTPERNVDVIRGDANTHLPIVLEKMAKRADRAVVFLDPYGMSVDWNTVKVCAESHLVDLWYLFPLSGLYRQAANDSRAIDKDKADSLTRMLGTDEWRTAFYTKSPQADLFSCDEHDVRTADVEQMTNWVTKRLEIIFPTVLRPKLLHQVLSNGKQGAPLFALYFAVSNPDHKARGLASRIAKDILST